MQHPLLFKKTASKKGRNWIITPENSVLDVLSYARIILDKSQNEVVFSNPDQESSLICLSGEGSVAFGDQVFSLAPYDTVFVPPGNEGKIIARGSLDLVESAAPSSKTGNPVYVPEAVLRKDKELFMKLGGDASRRQIRRPIDDNVPASRLLCGLIHSDQGQWTSWPPHEHADTKEEIYVYFDMPKPAFGIQLVYEDPDQPDFVGTVRQDDAVVIKKGYHPNVAVPGHPINFVWMMATLKENMVRSWGQMNVHPDFR